MHTIWTKKCVKIGQMSIKQDTQFEFYAGLCNQSNKTAHTYMKYWKVYYKIARSIVLKMFQRISDLVLRLLHS